MLTLIRMGGMFTCPCWFSLNPIQDGGGGAGGEKGHPQVFPLQILQT